MSRLPKWMMNPIYTENEKLGSYDLVKWENAVYSSVQRAVKCGKAEKNWLHLLEDFFELNKRLPAVEVSCRVESTSDSLLPPDTVKARSTLNSFSNGGSEVKRSSSTFESGFGSSTSSSVRRASATLFEPHDGRAFPIQLLTEKKSFCGAYESGGDCLRCASKKLRGCCGSSTAGSSSGEDSNFSHESVDQVKTCSFCYVHFKKHCQKIGRPWPRVTDDGFWRGHSTKDFNENVVCPQLYKLICPLCFATGSEAHTLKFCPLNTNFD